MKGGFRRAVRQRRSRDLELADGRVGVRAAGRPLHRDADRAGDAHLPGDGAHGPQHPEEAEDGEGQVSHRRTRIVQARKNECQMQLQNAAVQSRFHVPASTIQQLID